MIVGVVFNVRVAAVETALGATPLLTTHWNWSPFTATLETFTVSVAVAEPLYVVASSVRLTKVEVPLGCRCH